jgi:hypothetical protein
MPLSDFQRRVASIVFALGEAEGFVLAGGGALIAHDEGSRLLRAFARCRRPVLACNRRGDPQGRAER